MTAFIDKEASKHAAAIRRLLRMMIVIVVIEVLYSNDVDCSSGAIASI